MQLLHSYRFDIGHPLPNERNIRWLVSLTAMRRRCEVRTVCFQHDTVERNVGKNNIETAFLERCDTADAHIREPKIDPSQQVAGLLGKGVDYHVKDPARYAGKRVLIVGGGDSAVDWVLNLKEVLLRTHSNEVKTLRIEVEVTNLGPILSKATSVDTATPVGT